MPVVMAAVAVAMAMAMAAVEAIQMVVANSMQGLEAAVVKFR